MWAAVIRKRFEKHEGEAQAASAMCAASAP
jgi:hypothetical protein